MIIDTIALLALVLIVAIWLSVLYLDAKKIFELNHEIERLRCEIENERFRVIHFEEIFAKKNKVIKDQSEIINNLIAEIIRLKGINDKKD